MTYVAVLRGINVGGHRKVPMRDLRDCLHAQGFEDVSTHGNSGNVLFDAGVEEAADVVTLVRRGIEERFGFSVPVAVLSTADFVSAIDRAPDWWAEEKDSWRHDAIFLAPPARPGDFLDEVGPLGDAEDRVEAAGEVVFWSVPKKAYGRSPVAKVFNTSFYGNVTLRSSTTTLKLYDLVTAGHGPRP
jgi:uncharacterized protein (DUF1697 family)